MAIIFNSNSKGLYNEPTRAFFRHAVGAVYAETTKTETEGTTFLWQRVLFNALFTFRDAAVRWAVNIKRMYIARKYSFLTERVEFKTYSKYPYLVRFYIEDDNTANSDFHLTPIFLRTMDDVKQGLDARIANDAAAAPRRRNRAHQRT